jgi:predicted ATP-grasp superfamily ATP-dependent carboligase
MTTRILVYEYLSGGGDRALGTHDDEGTSELRAQGAAMRDAMVADLLHVADCSVSVAACEPGNTLPSGAVAVRPTPGEWAVDFVARHSARHDLVWLVAPETDGVLAQLARAVAPARWQGCSAGAIALASRKAATLAHLAAHGVLTPLAFVDTPETQRWVVKPDDGAGSVATQVYACHAEALRDHAWRTQAGALSTLEPWVDGEALSLSLMCGPQRAELLSINRQRIVLNAQGTLAFDGVDINVMRPTDPRWQPLAALAHQVANAMAGLRGFAGIDLVWHAQRGPVVIEVNPRVTCAYVGLSAALGRNLAADTLRACTGLRQLEAAHADA